MTVTIHVAGHLKDYTGEPLDTQIQGPVDVLDAILRLDAKVPNIKDRILDEQGRTRPYINIFVNEEDVRGLDGESTKLKDGDVIYILPSVAGGKGSLSPEEGRTG